MLKQAGELDPLNDLLKATVNRYTLFAKSIESGKPTGSSYYYPGLLAYQRKNRRIILMDTDEGSVCIYRWQVKDGKPRLDLYLAPNPMNTAVLHRCLERANDFNADISARILRIDEKDVEAVTGAGYRVHKRRQQYLFTPNYYADLSGSNLRTIRRNVANIDQMKNFEVRQYQQDDAEACTTLLKRWTHEHRKKQQTSGGYGYASRVIKLVGKLPEHVLTGQVVLKDGELVGYSFGGRIHSDLACYYDVKCDSQIRGLAYFLRRSFLLHMKEYPLVNDGSDGGRAGLQQIKQSFRPVAMHQEYQGHQKTKEL
jgi:hypothetical protein